MQGTIFLKIYFAKKQTEKKNVIHTDGTSFVNKSRYAHETLASYRGYVGGGKSGLVSKFKVSLRPSWDILASFLGNLRSSSINLSKQRKHWYQCNTLSWLSLTYRCMGSRRYSRLGRHMTKTTQQLGDLVTSPVLCSSVCVQYNTWQPLCIILNANQRTQNGGGLGMRLGICMHNYAEWNENTKLEITLDGSKNWVFKVFDGRADMESEWGGTCIWSDVLQTWHLGW